MEQSESLTGSSASEMQRSKAEMMQKRALDVGLAPGKNIFMQGFMMWMSHHAAGARGEREFEREREREFDSLRSVGGTYARSMCGDALEKLAAQVRLVHQYLVRCGVQRVYVD